MINCSPSTRKTVNTYLDFIHKRATGEILTGAAWMRKFVMNHPSYKHDSLVPQDIVYDMLDRLVKVCLPAWLELSRSAGEKSWIGPSWETWSSPTRWRKI